MQLDIFEHSRDVMLRGDVVAAIEQRDAVAARSAWHALRTEFVADECLPSLEVLVCALEHPSITPFASHDAAREARLDVQQRVAPAALRMLGPGAGGAWLALQWRGLAQRAAPLPFAAAEGEEHAAPLWLQAGAWDAAIEAVQRIESWRRFPAPLAWMAEARHRAHGLDAAWPLLAELAWLAPERFGALSLRLRDPVLGALRKTFDAEFEGDGDRDGDASDLAWFPAWVPIEQPALAGRLNEALPSLGTAPELAMRLVLELLRLERQGRHHELIERRQRLRSVGPALYRVYMKTR